VTGYIKAGLMQREKSAGDVRCYATVINTIREHFRLPLLCNTTVTNTPRESFRLPLLRNTTVENGLTTVARCFLLVPTEDK
jgi:hypothetical protein